MHINILFVPSPNISTTIFIQFLFFQADGGCRTHTNALASILLHTAIFNQEERITLEMQNTFQRTDEKNLDWDN